jgi:nicotinate-nucleotide adenylyltransferase
MKLGIYGGSFDPIHWGHLMLAECCREALELDQVWFVPAYQPPHKQRQLAAAEHRQAMLELATGGYPRFHVCNIELARQGTSFTVDTLEAIHELHPTARLYLLMGGDTLLDLPHWRRPERICELAQPVVVQRRGAAPIESPAIEVERVEMPMIELSSTEIRDRVLHGRSIRYRTSAAVEQYILQHALYRV